MGWPGQLGQGWMPLRRLRLWHVATVIPRVAEIVQRWRFVVILWISMIVLLGFLFLISIAMFDWCCGCILCSNASFAMLCLFPVLLAM